MRVSMLKLQKKHFRVLQRLLVLIDFSLACQTACDGWRNVDYVTEAAKFFSYWTFMPWIIVTYTGLSVIDGILGTGIHGPSRGGL